MKKVIIAPFNERGFIDNVKGSRAMLVVEKLDAGIKLTPIDQLWLTENVNNNTYFKDSVPVLGVRFNFKNFLKTYVVKHYGQWNEYKAYNKTSLRKYLYGNVEKIVEI